MEFSTQKEILSNVAKNLRAKGYEDIRLEVEVSISKHRGGIVDLVVYHDNKPFIVVETKNNLPETLDRFHPAIDQAFTYSKILATNFFLVTDSVREFWFEVIKENDSLRVNSISTPPTIPDRGEIASPLAQPITNVERNLESFTWELANLLRTKFAPVDYFSLLTELLLIKFFDETKNNYLKHVMAEEPVKPKEVIYSLKEEFYQNHGLRLDALDKLDGDLARQVVNLLSLVRITETKISNIDTIYNLFINRFSKEVSEKTHRYEIQIPLFLAKTMSDFFTYKEGDKILDPSVGTGGLLIAAFTKFSSQRKANLSGSPKMVGIYKDTELLASSMLNMALIGANNYKAIPGNFLSKNTREKIQDEFGSSFDYILSVLPTGYSIGNEETIKNTNLFKSRTANEALYIYQILEFLGPGKLAAVILAEGILSSVSYSDLRKHILSKADIKAVVSLPIGILENTGIKTSILIIQKKGQEVIEKPTLFMRVNSNGGSSENLVKESLQLVTNAYISFLKTGKIEKVYRAQLQATKAVISQEKNFRFDFQAYAPEYFELIDRLKRGPYKVLRLGDVATIRTGVHIKMDNQGDLEYVRSSNITHDGLLETFNRGFSPRTGPLSNTVIKRNDIVLTRNYQNFRSALVTKDLNNIVADSSIVILSPDVNILQPEYLLAVIRHKIVSTQLSYLSAGITTITTTPSTLADILIPIPSTEEQDRIIVNQKEAIRYRELAVEKQKETESLIDRSLSLEDDYEA